MKLALRYRLSRRLRFGEYAVIDTHTGDFVTLNGEPMRPMPKALAIELTGLLNMQATN